MRRKLFSGAAFSLASIVAVQGITLLTTIIYARFLGPTNLGVLSVFWQISAVVLPLSNLGLGIALVRSIPEYQKKNPEDLEPLLSSAFWITVIAGLIVSVVYFVLADYLAVLYGVPDLAVLIRISASLVIFTASLDLLSAFVQGFQRVKQLALLGIAARAISVPVVFYMTLTWGLVGVVLAGVVTLAMNLVIYSRTVRSILKSEGIKVPWRRLDYRNALKLLRTGLPLFAAFIVLRPALLFQSSLLALHISFADVGLFRVAMNLFGIALVIPNALAVPLLPAVSEMYATGTRDRTRGHLNALLRITALLSLPIALVLALGSGFIIQILYGSDYLSASTLVFIISIAAFIEAIGILLENTLLGTGRTMLVFLLTVMQAVAIGVGSYVLIPAYGLLGIGYATLLNAIVYTVIVSAYLIRTKELSLDGIRASLALAVAAFLAATAIVAFGGLNNLVVLALFVGAVIVIEWFLLTERDRLVLKDALKGIFE